MCKAWKQTSRDACRRFRHYTVLVRVRVQNLALKFVPANNSIALWPLLTITQSVLDECVQRTMVMIDITSGVGTRAPPHSGEFFSCMPKQLTVRVEAASPTCTRVAWDRNFEKRRIAVRKIVAHSDYQLNVDRDTNLVPHRYIALPECSSNTLNFSRFPRRGVEPPSSSYANGLLLGNNSGYYVHVGYKIMLTASKL